jgi:hypothetical protein
MASTAISITAPGDETYFTALDPNMKEPPGNIEAGIQAGEGRQRYPSPPIRIAAPL